MGSAILFRSIPPPLVPSAEVCVFCPIEIPTMRRSSEVKLTLLAAVALSVTACRPQHRDCADAQGRILPDSACQTGGGGYYGAHYIYGGSSGGHVGDAVVGGSTTSRGGFGSFGGSGDGGGE